MSTSFLYHTFGIVGYEYVSTRYQGGATFFTIRHNAEKLRCPKCGSFSVKRRGVAQRIFRTIPTGTRNNWLIMDPKIWTVC